jgi:8-oxo-dGTP pyrophosphatase MutT (NUDIX family)
MRGCEPKKNEEVEPKDASTVILVRDSARHAHKAIEVLMVLRHPASRFVAGSYVFPGGALDEEDCSGMEELCAGLSGETARKIIADTSSPGRSLGLWVAGIRETFEEVGLLLAYDRSGSLVSIRSPGEAEKFSGYRKGLWNKKIGFRRFLEKEDLRLAADRLHYYAHWITPAVLPIRYDVRFFVAAAPPGQNARHDGKELTRHVWITPGEALAAYEKRRFRMVLPTLMTMRELNAFRTTEEVIRSTRGKEIPAILTRMTRRGDRQFEILPDGSVFGPCPI